MGHAVLTTRSRRWYLITTVDRWIHYENRPVRYTYIILPPMTEFLRIIATMFHLWGAYAVVWNELQPRFDKSVQGKWWFAAKCVFFLVGLASFFYLILYLALAVVWLKFSTLNVIDDVATKRTGFEIAMTAFFFAFSLLTLLAGAVTMKTSKKVDGTGNHIIFTRIPLVLGIFFLWVRSMVEFGVVVRAYRSSETRVSLQLTTDVSYGLLTTLFLVSMCIMAYIAMRPEDEGGFDSRIVMERIRKLCIEKLEEDTHGGADASPAFERVLETVEHQIYAELAKDQPVMEPHGMRRVPENHPGRRAARQYIQHLKQEYGDMDPRKGIGYQSRAHSQANTPAIGGAVRQSVAGLGVRSLGALRHKIGRNSDSSMHSTQSLPNPRVRSSSAPTPGQVQRSTHLKSSSGSSLRRMGGAHLRQPHGNGRRGVSGGNAGYNPVPLEPTYEDEEMIPDTSIGHQQQQRYFSDPQTYQQQRYQQFDQQGQYSPQEQYQDQDEPRFTPLSPRDSVRSGRTAQSRQYSIPTVPQPAGPPRVPFSQEGDSRPALSPLQSQIRRKATPSQAAASSASSVAGSYSTAPLAQRGGLNGPPQTHNFSHPAPPPPAPPHRSGGGSFAGRLGSGQSPTSAAHASPLGAPPPPPPAPPQVFASGGGASSSAGDGAPRSAPAPPSASRWTSSRPGRFPQMAASNRPSQARLEGDEAHFEMVAVATAK